MCFICAQRDPGNALARVDTHSTVAPSSATLNSDQIWTGMRSVIETTDAGESTSTAYSLSVGQSATGVISSTSDEDWFAIELVAGRSYDFRLLGFDTDFLSDTLLTLRDSRGNMITSDDDGFTSGSNTHERDSALTFTATTTGTYYLEADAFGTRTGRYMLSATEDVAALPVLTNDEIAWQLMNNGNAFFGTTEAVAFDVGSDRVLTVDITDLNSQGQIFARAALDVWAAYLGFGFRYVSSGAEITFDDEDLGNAFANTFDNGTVITSATVNVAKDWVPGDRTLDSYTFGTYLHEIGHALGLGHGGNYNGTATYGVDNFYLNDSTAWTIMSYMGAADGFSSPPNSFVNASFEHNFSPMIADILAVQYMYGRSTRTFHGNTTYGFNGNTGVEALDRAASLAGGLLSMTVYDTGGIDTLDFSRTTQDQVISLTSESLSSVLGGRHNLGIARHTIVENASSGSGDDLLIGNSADNRLLGGAGNDSLRGSTGNDSLYGGDGTDTLNGGSGNDVYIIDSLDVIVERDGRDEVRGEFSINLGLSRLAGIENAMLSGRSGFSITGDEAANLLRGNDGANRISGGNGNDTIAGGRGADVLTGGLNNDVFKFYAITDLSTSVSSSDTITDFRRGQDRMDLSALDASTVLAGNNSFTFDGGTAHGTSSEGDIYFKRFDASGTANDYTLVYIDTDADRSSEGVIKLTGLHSLVAADFIL